MGRSQLHCGPVVTNLPCNAGMWVRSLGGGTMSPHAVEKLNATTEPLCSGACVTQLERSCATTKDLTGCNKDPTQPDE